MTKKKPTNLDDLTEFEYLDPDRVDAVGTPANGVPFLMLKSVDPTTTKRGSTTTMDPTKYAKKQAKLARLQRELAAETRSHAATGRDLIKARSARDAFAQMEDALDSAPTSQARRLAARRLLVAKMIAAENARWQNGFRPGSGIPIALVTTRRRPA